MALKLAKQVPNGFTCTYWVVGSVIASWFEKKMRVNLAGYKDEAARREGAEPGGSAAVELSFEGHADKPALYTALKTLPDFAEAEDC
jgi:hypothetical protein